MYFKNSFVSFWATIEQVPRHLMFAEPAGTVLVVLAPRSPPNMENMKLCGMMRGFTWRGTSSVWGRRR